MSLGLDSYSCAGVTSSLLTGTRALASHFNPYNGPRSCLRISLVGFAILHSSTIAGLMGRAVPSSSDEILAMPLDSDDSGLVDIFKGIGLIVGITFLMAAAVQCVAPTKTSKESATALQTA